MRYAFPYARPIRLMHFRMRQAAVDADRRGLASRVAALAAGTRGTLIDVIWFRFSRFDLI